MNKLCTSAMCKFVIFRHTVHNINASLNSFDLLFCSCISIENWQFQRQKSENLMKLYYIDGGYVEKALRKTVCLHVSACTQNVLLFRDSELFNNA